PLSQELGLHPKFPVLAFQLAQPGAFADVQRRFLAQGFVKVVAWGVFVQVAGMGSLIMWMSDVRVIKELARARLYGIVASRAGTS
ncbi:hypothetical protein ACIQ9Q_42930, partial [Streptomyces sp. NPDC094438]|uniref:hypothetical protein n=1 Tax=Streptomyces sp. NPDC094438 TaxID=3366061 RepID=UPI00382C0580